MMKSRIHALIAALTFALLIMSCAPERSPEEAKFVAEMGPQSVGVRSPSHSDGILAELRPFTNSGTVKTLGVEMRIPRQSSDRSQMVQISDADYNELRQAIGQGTSIDQASGLRIGSAVARATFCRAGPIALNRGITRWSAGQPRDARTPVAPVRFNPSFQPSIVVNLTCDATNPYFSAERLADARRPALTVAEFRAKTIGRTSLSFSRQHGTQVVYLGRDGTSYLWYPGNQRIVTGTWRIAPPRAPAPYPTICFDYGTAARDIFTGVVGTERCVAPGPYLGLEKEARNGDIFRLAATGLPFVMVKDKRYTIAELEARAQ